jgi:hypothetical protein
MNVTGVNARHWAAFGGVRGASGPVRSGPRAFVPTQRARRLPAAPLTRHGSLARARPAFGGDGRGQYRLGHPRRLVTQHPDRRQQDEHCHQHGAADAPLADGLDREQLTVGQVRAEQKADQGDAEPCQASELASQPERPQ